MKDKNNGFKRIKEIYISEINQALTPDKFEIYFKSSFKQLLEKLTKKGITKNTLVQGMSKLFEISEYHSEKLYTKFMDDTHNENECKALTVDFYKSWRFLTSHKIFNNSFVYDRLEIAVVKVNPVTNEVDDNIEKNTKVQVWLECFPNSAEGKIHDVDLDCGGNTFEDAIINLAELVEEKYGGLSE